MMNNSSAPSNNNIKKTGGNPLPNDNRGPRLFEMFFDLHHPAASLHCQRARLVKPPEGHDDRLSAEFCKPSFITNILCYAFPDFYMERDGTLLSTTIILLDRHFGSFVM